MSQVGNIDRTASDVSTLVHELYRDEVVPFLGHMSEMGGLFSKLGDGGYQLIGEKLQFAADYTYRGGFMGTDGYLPDAQDVDPLELSFTPIRAYIRIAIDNFIEAIARKPGAYEGKAERVVRNMWDAVARAETRHIHGTSAGTVCTFVSRTDANTLVVDAGYGYAGAQPTMFIEAGMTLALLDASNSYATIGAAVVDSVTHNTSETTATINFTSDIDTASTGADGDPLVFATTADESATHFVTERNRAPNGLIDIVDPANAATTYGGATKATYPRLDSVVRASSSFGQVEIMQFLAEIEARSNSKVTADSHVLTCQQAVLLEVAKELVQFQQQSQLGKKLEGGWDTVSVGGMNFLTDPQHLPDVLYALCPEDLFVVNLLEAELAADDGSQWSRLADYDGKEAFVRWYGNRFANRLNRLGALTGISVTSKNRWAAVPAA